MLILRLISFFACCAIATVPAAAREPVYPALQGKPVVDAANVIPDDQEAALNTKLFAYQKSTGHQLMVATVPDLQGQTIEAYAQGYFRHLKLGAKDRDDGTMFIIAMKEHKARFQTGTVMRALVTDADAGMMLRQSVIPFFKKNDYPGGIASGVDAYVKATTPMTPGEVAMKQRERQIAASRAAAQWASFKDFLMTLVTVLAAISAAVWAYWAATGPARRRRREEEQERVRLEREAAAERAAEDLRAEQARIREAAAARAAMLAAMSDADRIAFLDEERRVAEARRLAEETRLAEQRRLAEERRRAREAAEVIERARQAAEDAEEARRPKPIETSWTSSNDSSSDYFSGGGGDTSGGGASEGW